MEKYNIKNETNRDCMEASGMKQLIDQELKEVMLSEDMKNKIRNRAVCRKPNRLWKTAAAFAAVLVLGGATVTEWSWEEPQVLGSKANKYQSLY